MSNRTAVRLITEVDRVSVELGGERVIDRLIVDDVDTGFVAIGATSRHALEFDDVSIAQSNKSLGANCRVLRSGIRRALSVVPCRATVQSWPRWPGPSARLAAPPQWDEPLRRELLGAALRMNPPLPP